MGPGLVFSLRDHLYFNGYVIKEVTQQKYKTRSYNRDERVGIEKSQKVISYIIKALKSSARKMINF